MALSPEPDALSWAAAAGLGAVQGVAEFLPVSSSGHLALASHWLGIDPERGGHTLSVLLHAGTLLAVLLHYRRQIFGLLRDGAQPDGSRARKMMAAVVVATLPLGLVLLDPVRALFAGVEADPRKIGVALCATAAALAFSHRSKPPVDDPDEPPGLGVAALIGLAQLLAVTPGVSRSGATIAAALALGLGRGRAAQFSFLISIPAIAGATVDELGGLGDEALPWGPLALGFAVSFAVGLVALGALLRVLERVGLMPFVPYLVTVGALAIIFGG